MSSKTKLLEVTVVEGKELGSDPKSVPQVYVTTPKKSIGSAVTGAATYLTDSVKDKNPKWNKTNELEVDVSDTLRLDVWSKSTLRDTALGHVELPLKDAKNFAPEGVTLPLQSKGKTKSGTLTVKLHWKEASADKSLGQETSKDLGCYTVTIHQAKNLQGANNDGTNDTYVTVQLGKVKQRTEIITDSVNPVWKNEIFNFRVAEGPIKITIMDDNILYRNALLGRIEIPTTNLAPRKPVDQWYPLLDKKGQPVGKSEIRVTVEYDPDAKAKVEHKTFVGKLVTKSARKIRQTTKTGGYEVIKNPLRLMLRISILIRNRMIEKGYEGRVKGVFGILMLSVGCKVTTDSCEQKEEEEDEEDSLDEKEKTRLSRLADFIVFKLLDLIQAMAQEYKERGLEGSIGTRLYVEYLVLGAAGLVSPITFAYGISVDTDSVKDLGKVKSESEDSTVVDDAPYVMPEQADAIHESKVQESKNKETLGVLKVTIVEVKNVKSLTDKSSLGSAEEIYCQVGVGKERRATDSVKDTSKESKSLVSLENASWNKTFIFPAPQSKPPTQVDLELKYKGGKGLLATVTRHHGSLGKGRVSVSQFNPSLDTWVPIMPSESPETSLHVVGVYDKNASYKELEKEAKNKKPVSRKAIQKATLVMIYAIMRLRKRAHERGVPGLVQAKYVTMALEFGLGLETGNEEDSSSEEETNQKLQSQLDEQSVPAKVDEKVSEEEEEEAIVENNKPTPALQRAIDAGVDGILSAIEIGGQTAVKRKLNAILLAGYFLDVVFFEMELYLEVESEFFQKEVKLEVASNTLTSSTTAVATTEKVDPNAKGTLNVTVVQGKDFPKTGTNGCDSYCKVFVGTEKQQTDVRTQTINPEWNKQFAFSAIGGAPKEVKVEIKDDYSLRANKVLGTVTIETSKLAPNEAREPAWFELKNPAGESAGYIQLSFQYLPNVAPPKATRSFKVVKSITRKVTKGVNKSTKSTIRSAYRIAFYACLTLLKSMKERGYQGKAISELDVLVTCACVTIDTETFEKEAQGEKIEVPDGRVANVIAALVDKLLTVGRIGALEAQRQGTDGTLKVMVGAGIPPPFPEWFEIGMKLVLRVDSVREDS